MTRQYLSQREKFGFGLGDMSSNIVFQAVGNVLLYFYTDVFGLTGAAATLLRAVVRVIDAIIDPAIGAMADRTRSKHGRYRPWLLWLAIPYGVIAVAAFITPGVSEGAKLVYAYVSYILLVVQPAIGKSFFHEMPSCRPQKVTRFTARWRSRMRNICS